MDEKLERLMGELAQNQTCLQQLKSDQAQLQSDLDEKDRHLKSALSENDRLNELIREFEELNRPSEETLVETDSMDQLLANLKTVITFIITCFLIKHDHETRKSL